MKKAVILVGIVFALFAPAFGQWPSPKAKILVPFEFAVGNSVLPAGTYTVSMDMQMHALTLWNREAGVSAIALAHDILLPASAPAADSSRLVFAFDGQRHVLHQVVLNGDNRIHDLIHGAEIAELMGTRPT